MMWRIGKKRSLFSSSSVATGHRNTECADSQTQTPWAHLHAHPVRNNRRRVSVISRAGCLKWSAQGAHIERGTTTGNTAARFAERTPAEHRHAKKTVTPNWSHRSLLFNLFSFSLEWWGRIMNVFPSFQKLKCPIALSSCGYFLQRINLCSLEDWYIANDNCYRYDSHCNNSHSFHKTISFLFLLNNYWLILN